MGQETLNWVETSSINSKQLIEGFKVIDSGTVTVTAQANPTTTDIVAPIKLYANYVLMINNKAGQTLNTVNVKGKTSVANTPIPNTPVGTAFDLKIIPLSPTLGTGFKGAADITSEEPNPFVLGLTQIQFNLASAGTGTIDWALIGY